MSELLRHPTPSEVFLTGLFPVVRRLSDKEVKESASLMRLFEKWLEVNMGEDAEAFVDGSNIKKKLESVRSVARSLFSEQEFCESVGLENSWLTSFESPEVVEIEKYRLIQRALIRSSHFFHVRKIEREFKLIPEGSLIDDLVDDSFKFKDLTVDFYDLESLTRIRLSKLFGNRVSVKLPLEESEDGLRTRLKLEYKGNPIGNPAFDEFVRHCALLFFDVGGQVTIRQGVPIVSRGQMRKPPLWLDRKLRLKDDVRFELRGGALNDRSRLLNEILEHPLLYCETEEIFLEAEIGEGERVDRVIKEFLCEAKIELIKEIIRSSKISEI